MAKSADDALAADDAARRKEVEVIDTGVEIEVLTDVAGGNEVEGRRG